VTQLFLDSTTYRHTKISTALISIEDEDNGKGNLIAIDAQ
jgi:hypothetical protein